MVGGVVFMTRMSIGSGSDVWLVVALSLSDDTSTGLFLSGLCSTILFSALSDTRGKVSADLYP